jgi:hypothetical protein
MTRLRNRHHEDLNGMPRDIAATFEAVDAIPPARDIGGRSASVLMGQTRWSPALTAMLEMTPIATAGKVASAQLTRVELRYFAFARGIDAGTSSVLRCCTTLSNPLYCPDCPELR